MPDVPLMFVVVFEEVRRDRVKSAARRADGAERDVEEPHAAIEAPTGNVKMLPAELPQLPVAEPYSMVQPARLTAAPLEL